MVITRRTRNPLAVRGTWVRIPPAPPELFKRPLTGGAFLYSAEGSFKNIALAGSKNFQEKQINMERGVIFLQDLC